MLSFLYVTPRTGFELLHYLVEGIIDLYGYLYLSNTLWYSRFTRSHKSHAVQAKAEGCDRGAGSGGGERGGGNLSIDHRCAETRPSFRNFTPCFMAPAAAPTNFQLPVLALGLAVLLLRQTQWLLSKINHASNQCHPLSEPTAAVFETQHVAAAIYQCRAGAGCYLVIRYVSESPTRRRKRTSKVVMRNVL